MAVSLLSNDLKRPVVLTGYPLKSITETVTNGFFTLDRSWMVQYWNKAAERLLGVKAKDIVGKNLWEKFVGIIPVEFYDVYPKAFLLDIPYHFEEYWGEMGAWFDVIVYNCNDTLSVSFKSSNQLPADDPDNPEQLLKTQNELYRFISEVSNDCLWEWDMASNEIFWIDGGHKKAFGYDIENAFIPRDFWEGRLHKDDKTRVLEKLKSAIDSGASCYWEDDYRFRKADGNYAYVHDRGYIIYDEDKTASRIIAATLDVTTAKLNEIRLVETEKRLMQVISYFSLGIKSDVEISLSHINLALEMLESIFKDSELQTFLEIIKSNSKRLNTLFYMLKYIEHDETFPKDLPQI